jgi:hypothetical protein
MQYVAAVASTFGHAYDDTTTINFSFGMLKSSGALCDHETGPSQSVHLAR